jgi:hypothetical protein
MVAHHEHIGAFEVRSLLMFLLPYRDRHYVETASSSKLAIGTGD